MYFKRILRGFSKYVMVAPNQAGCFLMVFGIFANHHTIFNSNPEGLHITSLCSKPQHFHTLSNTILKAKNICTQNLNFYNF